MKEKEFENLLLVEGINAKGFGTIAKMVMIDRRLHPYSKAIYSYFCSFAGSVSTAFPSVSKIMYDLNMSKKTIGQKRTVRIISINAAIVPFPTSSQKLILIF